MPELDRMGRDELHYAAMQDNVDVVRARLAAGVDVNLAEKRQGWRPLHFAIQDGAVHAARVLLEAGADLQTPDTSSATPLHLAVKSWRRCPNGDMIKLLIEHGADKTAVEKNGRTPADVARGQFRFPDELMELVHS